MDVSYTNFAEVEASFRANEASEPVSLKSLGESAIGVVDFSILMLMWLIAFAASIQGMGKFPGIAFILFTLILALRNPSNVVMVWILMFFIPDLPLQIFNMFKIIFVISGLSYLVHGRFVNMNRSLNSLMLSCVCLSVFLGLTIFIAPSFKRGLGSFLPYVEGLFSLFLLFGLVQTREEVGRILKWWAIVAALSLVLSLTHYILGPGTFAGQLARLASADEESHSIVGVGKDIAGRILFPGLTPNGHSMNLAFSLGIGLAFYSVSSYRTKLFWLIVTLMIGFGIVGTYSRSGFLVACAVVGLYLMRRNIRAIVPVFVIIIFGIALLRFMPSLAGRMGSIQEDIVERGGTGRFALWKNAIGFWLSSPLWGIGLGGLVSRTGLVAHNTYINILAEGGLIAFGLYSWTIGVVLQSFRKFRLLYGDQKDPDVIFSQTLLLGFLGMLLHLNTITQTHTMFFWWQCGLCFLLYQLTVKEADEVTYGDFD